MVPAQTKECGRARGQQLEYGRRTFARHAKKQRQNYGKMLGLGGNWRGKERENKDKSCIIKWFKYAIIMTRKKLSINNMIFVFLEIKLHLFLINLLTTKTHIIRRSITFAYLSHM